MPRYTDGYEDLRRSVRDHLGITVEPYNTGGNILVWQGVIETGHWLWISDYDADITPRGDRERLEAEGIDVGWRISLHPPGDEHDVDCCTLLASVAHQKARSTDFLNLLVQTLANLPTNTHHDTTGAGITTITRGIQSY